MVLKPSVRPDTGTTFRGCIDRMTKRVEAARCLALATLLISLGTSALAQDRRTAGATGTLPPAASGQSSREWSGESGSSGHPLMTADAIRSSAANFSACVESLWPLAARRGVARASFETHTRDLTPDLRIMDLMDTQPEFTKAFWDYLDILVTDARIQ